MIKYSYKKRELNIPDGFGNLNKEACGECVLQNKNAVISSDLSTIYPDAGYNGIGRITVDATVYGGMKWNEGVVYAEGQLTETAITENGVYERELGWDKVTVNVPSDPQDLERSYQSGYTSGYTDGHIDGVESGITYQKSLLTSGTFNTNGRHTRKDGWSAITINVPSDPQELQDYYNSGYTSGVTHQKSLLSAATFTQNGTYTREDGFSSVTVNATSSNIVEMTQQEYDALTEYDNSTFYAIKN